MVSLDSFSFALTENAEKIRLGARSHTGLEMLPSIADNYVLAYHRATKFT
jgi:hypothetical protein